MHVSACTWKCKYNSFFLTLHVMCHGPGEPPPHEKKSPPLLPDNVLGKINPFKWWRILFDSIFPPLKPSCAVIGGVKQGVVLV